MIENFVFVCGSLVTSAAAHVKPLTTNTEDGADARSCRQPSHKLAKVIDNKTVAFVIDN